MVTNLLIVLAVQLQTTFTVFVVNGACLNKSKLLHSLLVM